MTEQSPQNNTSSKQHLSPKGLELFLLRSSQVLAFFGGLVLLTLTLITVYSIVGRTIIKSDWLSDFVLLAWWRPIRGDFELIELGTALAISSFFPYCQMVRGNVMVDFFTSQAHPRLKSAMAIFANLLFSVVSLLITWRMFVGSEEFFTATFKQSSMILRIPTWVGMFIVTGFMCLLSLVCLFTLYRSIKETFAKGEPTGRAA